jgi:hypothetical protein
VPHILPTPLKPTARPPDIAAQMAALKLMLSLPTADAIGACCSFLLQASMDHPQSVRAVLNERIIREGHSGISLLEHLQRIAK